MAVADLGQVFQILKDQFRNICEHLFSVIRIKRMEHAVVGPNKDDAVLGKVGSDIALENR